MNYFRDGRQQLRDLLSDLRLLWARIARPYAFAGRPA